MGLSMPLRRLDRHVLIFEVANKCDELILRNFDGISEFPQEICVHVLGSALNKSLDLVSVKSRSRLKATNG